MVAFPGSLAVTRGILRTEGACGVSKSIMSGVPQPRLVSSVGSSTDIAGDSVPNLLFNQPREGLAGGQLPPPPAAHLIS
ncbi:hypothetical protein VNO80_34420 [Phaseolus coccineus]|uniref:Uncharacterized protein n=1 Tax=Phaseolus coccineus TaxID=3886 RepID=A0AAN9KY65_PHACN